jgi:ABC-2 type transport system permease protein
MPPALRPRSLRPGPFRPYLAIFTARFRTMLQYRGAALGGVVTQAFFGLVRIMILEGFYRSSATTPSLGFAAAVGYVWLGQAAFTLQPYNLDRQVRTMVASGTVAYELVRPLHLYAFWYCRAVAWRSAPVVLRLVPMVVIAALILPLCGLGSWAMRPPVSLAAGAAWLLTMGGALAVSAAITTLMSISLLWTISGEGIAVLVSALTALLSGMIIPLPLFPEWAQVGLRALPFAALLDLPARLYTGHIPAAQAGWVLAQQLAWTAAMAALGSWLVGRATRRLVVQGG